MSSSIETVEPSTAMPSEQPRGIHGEKSHGGRFSMIMLIVIALVFFGSWVAPGAAHLLDLSASFQWQWMILLVLIAAYQLIRKRVALAMLFGLLSLWPSYHVAAWYLPVAQPPAGETQVRFLTLNLLNVNDDVNALRRLIHEVDPDVINLQECTQLWRDQLDDVLDAYPHQINDPYSIVSGNLLCSRLPMQRFENSRILNNPLVPAICGRLEVDGRSILVMGVHTTSPTTTARMYAREQQIRLLQMVVVRFQNRYPIIALGDFNATATAYSIRSLLRETRLRDSRWGFGMQSSWPSWCWPLRICIDHAFVSDDIHVVNRRVERHVGSDHLPVVIDLSVSPGS